MSTKQRIAAILFYLVAALFLVAAVADLFMTTPPAHEVAFLGETQATINLRVAELILLLTRMIGAWYIAIAIAIIYLTEAACRYGELKARLALAGIIVLPNLLILLMTHRLGWGPNMIAPIADIAIAVIALLLATPARNFGKRQSERGTT